VKIGIIAEDHSDVAVVREITLRLMQPHRIGFRWFIGHGCGKLRRKCKAWTESLIAQGCPWIVIVHDLDNNGQDALRALITAQIAGCGHEESVVLIPKREIEAWLMYDADAIAAAFNENKLITLPGDPEKVAKPKEHLGKLIWKHYRKLYLNTTHNLKIAQRITMCKLDKAESFSLHPPFTERIKGRLRARQGRSKHKAHH